MRQLVCNLLPDQNGCVYIEGKNFHYLTSVLRLAVGDMVYVRLPGGVLQQMTLAKVDTKTACATLTIAGNDVTDSSTVKAVPIKDKPACSLWLFMFAAKPPKMELIVRQATECGVERIIPVAGKFCQKGNIDSCKKKSGGDDNRWTRIITEAREQSGSPVETVVSECVTFEEALSLWKERCKADNEKCGAVVLYEQTRDTVAMHKALGKAPFECVAIMVGAEGGISPEELKSAAEAGFTPVHFNTNILRCETAALYGIATVQNTITESEKWLLKE